MTSLALSPPAPASRILATLLERERGLTRYALLLLALTVPVLALRLIDPRLLGGVSGSARR